MNFKIICESEHQKEYGKSLSERLTDKIDKLFIEGYEPISIGGAGGAGKGDIISSNTICVLMKK